MTFANMDSDCRVSVSDLREIGAAIKASAALIDGEVVALGEDGLPQFDALRFRRDRKSSIVFYAFDLLHRDALISLLAHW